jgi:hypothetical protein
MNPSYWLLIVLVSMAAVCFFVALIAYQIGYDRGHMDAQPDRHTHRKGDPLEPLPSPLPRPGRLSLADLAEQGAFGPPVAEWVFSGGAEEWRPLDRAEYDLMTAEPDRGPGEITTVEQAIALDLAMADQLPDDETPSGFTRRMAREVEAMIAAWEGDTNYWLHTHRADT